MQNGNAKPAAIPGNIPAIFKIIVRIRTTANPINPVFFNLLIAHKGTYLYEV